MREILFRAKRLDNGEWLEGYYAIVGDKHVIIKKEMETYLALDHNYRHEKRTGSEVVQVLFHTVGQFTGTCAYNGQKIYEGDIVETGSPEKKKCSVKFNEASGAYELHEIGGQYFHTIDCFLPYQIEVVGNIYDNRELLEVE